MTGEAKRWRAWARRHMVVLAGCAVVATLFWLLLQRRYCQDLNYTFVISSALLHGALGTHSAPGWLNELVPAGNGLYYSVFPLGAVLSVLPGSLLVGLGILGAYPANPAVTLLAAGSFGLASAGT